MGFEMRGGKTIVDGEIEEALKKGGTKIEGNVKQIISNKGGYMLEIASILIVTYNHKNYLKTCIESIQNQDYPHEIILIDNDSTDGTPEYAKEKFPFVKVIESKKNLGYGAGNNLGVKYTRGEYIVILNPDTVVETDWLRELIEPLKKEARLITTPKILLYDGSAISACGLVAHFTGLTFARGYLEKSSEFQKVEYVSCFSGACFAMKKRDFEGLGGFDENFFTYNEDSDLSWSAHLRGFEIIAVPTSVIRHDYTLKVSPEKLYHVEKGRYMLLRKHLTGRDFLLLFPSLLVAEILTCGYAIKHGWKGLKYKLKAMKEGLTVKVDKIEGDKDNLFKSLSVTIPVEQLTSNKVEKSITTLGNKVFEWNFRVVK